MNSGIVYLRQGAVWKSTPDGSRIYLPAQRRTFVLSKAETDQFLGTTLPPNSESWPKGLPPLVQEQVLTPQEENGRPLVPNSVEPRLDYVVLRITNACDLRCRHCFVASGQPEPDELSYGELVHLFASLEIFNPLVVVLTGGEPHLRPDMFDIAGLAATHNSAVDISTNGISWRKADLERLTRLPNLRYVIVSLEGPSAEIHDYIRGPGNFEVVRTFVRSLVERNVAVSVNHCVTALNLPYLSQTIDLALSWGTQSVHLAAVSESGRAQNHWAELSLSLEQRQEVSLVSLRKFVETGGRVLAGEAEREVSGFNDATSEAHNCGVGRDWCMIYANGDVAPCRPVYSAIGAAGNVRVQSFETIWRDSPLLNRLRAIRDDQLPRCCTCRWRRRCQGGCRARAYLRTGSWISPESEEHCLAYDRMNAQIDQLLTQSILNRGGVSL